jgi:hypothetical protein
LGLDYSYSERGLSARPFQATLFAVTLCSGPSATEAMNAADVLPFSEPRHGKQPNAVFVASMIRRFPAALSLRFFRAGTAFDACPE